jgi:hypothetical protein
VALPWIGEVERREIDQTVFVIDRDVADDAVAGIGGELAVERQLGDCGGRGRVIVTT